MIIKKLGKIYALLCLCGDMDKLKRLEANIKIREDNETLREKYMVILDDLS
jgi:acetone carboxylase gamma subunit